jgi:hypothetical protein
MSAWVEIVKGAATVAEGAAEAEEIGAGAASIGGAQGYAWWDPNGWNDWINRNVFGTESKGKKRKREDEEIKRQNEEERKKPKQPRDQRQWGPDDYDRAHISERQLLLPNNSNNSNNLSDVNLLDPEQQPLLSNNSNNLNNNVSKSYDLTQPTQRRRGQFSSNSNQNDVDRSQYVPADETVRMRSSGGFNDQYSRFSGRMDPRNWLRKLIEKARNMNISLKQLCAMLGITEALLVAILASYLPNTTGDPKLFLPKDGPGGSGTAPVKPEPNPIPPDIPPMPPIDPPAPPVNPWPPYQPNPPDSGDNADKRPIIPLPITDLPMPDAILMPDAVTVKEWEQRVGSPEFLDMIGTALMYFILTSSV